MQDLRDKVTIITGGARGLGAAICRTLGQEQARIIVVEVRRVLKPGGVLRLGLPDLDKALQAYLRKDALLCPGSGCPQFRREADYPNYLLWFGAHPIYL